MRESHTESFDSQSQNSDAFSKLIDGNKLAGSMRDPYVAWAEYDRVSLTDVVDAKIVGAKQEIPGPPLRISREPPPLPGDQPPALHAAGRKLLRP